MLAMPEELQASLVERWWKGGAAPRNADANHSETLDELVARAKEKIVDRAHASPHRELVIQVAVSTLLPLVLKLSIVVGPSPAWCPIGHPQQRCCRCLTVHPPTSRPKASTVATAAAILPFTVMNRAPEVTKAQPRPDCSSTDGRSDAAPRWPRGVPLLGSSRALGSG